MSLKDGRSRSIACSKGQKYLFRASKRLSMDPRNCPLMKISLVHSCCLVLALLETFLHGCLNRASAHCSPIPLLRFLSAGPDFFFFFLFFPFASLLISVATQIPMVHDRPFFQRPRRYDTCFDHEAVFCPSRAASRQPTVRIAAGPCDASGTSFTCRATKRHRCINVLHIRRHPPRESIQRCDDDKYLIHVIFLAFRNRALIHLFFLSFPLFLFHGIHGRTSQG